MKPANQTLIHYRQLGQSDLSISSVAMGCWPITGMTSLDVNEADSRATLEAAANAGINFFDSAYCYGKNGESERLIHQALGDRRDELVIATKGGIEWSPDGSRLIDGAASTLRRQCDESLDRLDTDRIDLYYLHAPDPNTPIEESASAIAELIQSGKIRYAGTSNCNLAQLETFHAICPLTAIQPHYNMLQREIERDILPWAARNQVGTVVYWPLLKGLLSGHLPRDFVFRPGDGRAKYPMFQGEEWERNQGFLDALREIAKELNRSVTEIVINWTIHQSNITSALCGAKRPYQIVDSAQAMTFRLSEETLQVIEQALRKRGVPATTGAV
ncbi:aldo/keto reductase [Verrucomicrobia bacterium]|nr:aldo/keto reductase [Verrucomicrobiota bacterium]